MSNLEEKRDLEGIGGWLVKRNPEGIGGWLIIPLINMILSSIRNGVVLYEMFSGEVWQILTSPSSGLYDLFLVPSLIFLLVGSVMKMATALIALFFLLRKSKYTPRLAIVWLLTNGIFSLWSLIFVSQIGVAEGGLFMALWSTIFTITWVWYFLVSRRVKATFVR